jgi:hypothetical protein
MYPPLPGLAFDFCVSACNPKEETVLKDTTSSKYQVGQVWSYHTRPGEEKSRLLILKVEEAENKEARVLVHVYVGDISVTMVPAIPHMVFSEDAIDNSVIELLGHTSSLPAFRLHYDTWRKNFVKSHIGVFDLTVAEVIDVIEITTKMGTFHLP